MSDDFAVVDFAVMGAGPARVARALGQVIAIQACASAKGTGEGRAASGRLLSRLMHRGEGQDQPRLYIHEASALGPKPLAQLLPDELGFGTEGGRFRVTAPLGTSQMTLIEFLEHDAESSPLCEALSAELPGTEVFRFRLSGQRHRGSETAFQVYLDGRAIRRCASFSPLGTAPEASWQVTDTGMPHAVEADSLPGARARAWEIMTPERQGSILFALGIDHEQLFIDQPSSVSVALTTADDGRPMYEIDDFLRVSPNTASPVEDHDAPLIDQRDTDEDWEAEVTKLLVSAVVHALPESRHVPWLTDLTARLEAGEVATALAEAHALIEAGQRAEEAKREDAARLDALFGVTSHGTSAAAVEHDEPRV